MSDSTIVKPKVDISEKIKKQAKEQEQLEQQVIVHCEIVTPKNIPMGIRIWPSTFLLDNKSDHKSQLLHQENIPLMPDWKSLPTDSKYTFTLVFSALPKTCVKFHLVELIPQKGGFQALNIVRTYTDVYHVKL